MIVETVAKLTGGRDTISTNPGTPPVIKIAASIACANWRHLEEDIRALERGGIDLLHSDVVDGEFARTFIMGPPIISAIRGITRVPFDIHLAAYNPEKHLEQFVEAGGDIISVHIEACSDLKHTVRMIRKLGARASVAFKPDTPLSLPKLEPVLEDIDMVLLMTVNPGFAG